MLLGIPISPTSYLPHFLSPPLPISPTSYFPHFLSSPPVREDVLPPNQQPKAAIVALIMGAQAGPEGCGALGRGCI